MSRKWISSVVVCLFAVMVVGADKPTSIDPQTVAEAQARLDKKPKPATQEIQAMEIERLQDQIARLKKENAELRSKIDAIADRRPVNANEKNAKDRALQQLIYPHLDHSLREKR